MKHRDWVVSAVILIIGVTSTRLAGAPQDVDDPPDSDAATEPDASTTATADPTANRRDDAPTLAQHGTLRLRYEAELTESEAERANREHRRGGGGMVAVMNEVADRISNAGGSGDAAHDARRVRADGALELDVFLTETLNDDGTPGPWVVTFAPTASDVTIDERIEASTRERLEREATALRELFATYTQTLTDEQVLRLRLTGQTPLDVDGPMDVLATWARPSMRLTLFRSLEPEVVDIRFHIVSPSGLVPADELPTATPCVVEIRFNRAPERQVHLVELDAGRDVRKLVAQRVDANPRRFMTPQFVAWRYDHGLPPERPGVNLPEPAPDPIATTVPGDTEGDDR